MAEENAFVKALAAAQAEMDNAAFDKTNPHFKSKYASLASVRNACQAILNKHGFAVIATTEFWGNEFVEKTELIHVSGECRVSYWPIKPGTSQQQGSDYTYGRRYGLSGLAGIASEEDDDGNISALAKPKSAYQGRKEGFYPIAQQAIRDCQTLTELKNWWVKNYEQIQAMPPQWIPLLEEEKDRRKLELADELEPVTTPLKQALQQSLEQVKKTLVPSKMIVPELTDEEAAEIDDVLTSDPHAYLTGLDGDLATAQNDIDLMEIWAEHQGIKEVLATKDQAQAELIFEKHSRRLKADAGVKAFKAGKK